MQHPRIPTARRMMSKRVITLRDDMTVIDAMRTLVRRRISGAPVVTADGTLVGIVSEFDCLHMVASDLYDDENWEANTPVSEIMSRDVVAIGPDTDVFSITQLLVDKRIRRVPVVHDGRVVGLVSRRDVLRGVHELRRANVPTPERPHPKGLYLSVLDEAGEEIDSLLE